MKRDLTAGGVSKHSGIKDYDTYYAETLYQSVCKAILDLNNFNIRQSLKDHDAWIEHLHVLNKGLSGSYIDNSGNFGNQLLN
jgi:hypothetical protein